jgi:hypothetical protein
MFNQKKKNIENLSMAEIASIKAKFVLADDFTYSCGTLKKSKTRGYTRIPRKEILADYGVKYNVVM